LAVRFGLIVALVAIVLMPLTVALAQQANPVRVLPDTVERRETFNVTVTFTAPADKFNAIGLTDFCPDGWNVTVSTAWCTPTADAVKATGNEAEIAWFGEPDVGFDKGTSFSALYKVTVPDDALAGIHTFDGFLQYYLASEGPYYENITGDSEAEVTVPTLEGHIDLFREEAAGGPTWETPIVVRFFDNSTKLEMAWSPINVTTDAYGNFTIEDIEIDTYDIGVKNWTCLSELNTSVVFSGGNTTVVDFGAAREGDCHHVSGEDWVNYDDYIDFLINYDQVYANADFERSGKVGYRDYIALLLHYDKKGDVRLYTT